MDTSEFRFAFHAVDFAASVGFYRDALGMTEVGGWDRPDGKGALLSAGGNAVVEIYGAAEGGTYDGPPPQNLNLAMRQDDEASVDALQARLTDAGYEVDNAEAKPWGHYSMVVSDPDGIAIHIYCETTTK